MNITISADDGSILVVASDLSDAIAKLAALATQKISEVNGYASRLYEASMLPPDISATADEHVPVFCAGWKAGRDAAVNHTHPSD